MLGAIAAVGPSAISTVGEVMDSGSWFDPIVDGVSSAFNYLSENEWAANAVAGAATAGLNYYANKEAAKEAEKMARKQNEWANQRYYSQTGGVDLVGGYRGGSLTNGILIGERHGHSR